MSGKNNLFMSEKLIKQTSLFYREYRPDSSSSGPNMSRYVYLCKNVFTAFDERRSQASFWPVGVVIPRHGYAENFDIPLRTSKFPLSPTPLDFCRAIRSKAKEFV